MVLECQDVFGVGLIYFTMMVELTDLDVKKKQNQKTNKHNDNFFLSLLQLYSEKIQDF